MLKLRQFHRYLGVFFTPAILFFAFSGALQTFGLHEGAHRDEPPPVAWIATIASVHKDQHLLQESNAPAIKPAASAPNAGLPVKAPEAARAVAQSKVTASEQKKKKSPLPLKLFVLTLAIGLCVSALLGVTIAFTNTSNRKAAAIMLVLGTLLPAVLLFM